jgi:hypothetical protein
MILWQLIVLLILGILMAALAVGVWMLTQREASIPPVRPESTIPKITFPDGNLAAAFLKRPDGTYQVEVRRRGQDDSPDTGVTETWTLIYGLVITGTLEEAVEIANQHMGA